MSVKENLPNNFLIACIFSEPISTFLLFNSFFPATITTNSPSKFLGFFSIYRDYFLEHREKIKNKLDEFKNEKSKIVSTKLYSMSSRINYKELYKAFMEECYDKFSK